ncbi:hypothetical protein KEH51_20205 [[Brevibacterium] frigoritolerans]|uniref:Uncharacterized protein n=1 Tax=Peribacillus frigoritolerans TaxID=450367 RepID=A0A941J7E0_9BACI|nr:hypothetical protein [Peribacillus frigoritolerans]
MFQKEVPVDWNVRYETPAGKAWPGRPLQASAEEAPDRPRKASVWRQRFTFTMGIVFGSRMPYRKYRNKPIYYL